MKGAFIVSREIFENNIWDDVQKFRIFLFILGNAVFKEDGIRKGSVKIGRGQYLRSYRNLQKDLEYLENRAVKKYPLSTIKRKIHRLVEENRLEIEETELGTLFTVVNYDKYQVLDNYKNELGTELEQPGNSEGTGMEQRGNNKKYVKNVKNKNTTSNQDSLVSDFEKLWKLYPNKKGKAAALKSYKRAIKKGATNKQIQDGIVAYKKHIVEKGIEQDYQKHGSTFFNQESWNDTYSTEQQNAGSSSSIPYLDEKGVYE